MKPPRPYITSSRRLLLKHRRNIRTVALALLLLACLRSFVLALTKTQPLAILARRSRSLAFEPLNITGFVNDGVQGDRMCDELRYSGQVQVQKSWFLDDDLVHIARSLHDHPMLDYSGQDTSLPFEETVAQTWTRLSGSSVWLDQYQVFLAVTRVIFYDEGVKQWPVISFLRGQIYDKNWNELKTYTLSWHGRKLTFPTVFPIQAPYKSGAHFFGPEDPRVIIEEGVDDAEPVIVFNMIYMFEPWTRAMHIFRPFSESLTILTINGDEDRAVAEKNWAPFFMNNPAGQDSKQSPSEYIHFIYRFSPLVVLRCKLVGGLCDVIYEQDTAEYELGEHDDDDGRMTGGTSLVPLPIRSRFGANLFLGFPRSHVDVGCNGKSIYRPAIMILSAHDKDFHLDFVSDSLDFGSAAMPEEAFLDPCGEGQILIANSIAKWDLGPGHDILTLSFSVADSTVQMLRLRGLYAFIQRLYPQQGLALGSPGKLQGDLAARWSDTGSHVLGCSMEAAANYSTAFYIAGYYKMQEAMSRGGGG